MDISNIISLFGGIALFLFGMGLMGEGLKKVAGSQMELILFRLSGTPLKGLLLGAGVTAVIQSSSATSVMLVGFVNSGMMKTKQALSVIHGALIGTSITGWIICLSYLGGESGWASLLSTSTMAALFAVAGILLRMTAKRPVHKHAGDILLGFTVLMYGLQSMSGAVSPLKDSPAFLSLLTTFSHPLVGLLLGAAVTAVLQSASAAIGILQALSATGAITFSVAYPIILGIAVGASVPVLLSALGAKVEGRRTAFLYLIVEVVAAFLFAVLYYALDAAVSLGLQQRVMDPFSVAAVNTLFRVLTAVFLMPFNRRFIALSEKLIRVSETERSQNASSFLSGGVVACMTKSFNKLQLKKQPSSRTHSSSDNTTTRRNWEQPLKQPPLIRFRFWGSLMDMRALQSVKQLAPICFKLWGRTIR